MGLGFRAVLQGLWCQGFRASGLKLHGFGVWVGFRWSCMYRGAEARLALLQLD